MSSVNVWDIDRLIPKGTLKTTDIIKFTFSISHAIKEKLVSSMKHVPFVLLWQTVFLKNYLCGFLSPPLIFDLLEDPIHSCPFDSLNNHMGRPYFSPT